MKEMPEKPEVQDTAEGDVTYPYYGISQIVDGHVRIQDPLGRYYYFTNITPTVKD